MAQPEEKPSYAIAAKARGPGPAYMIPPSLGYEDHILTKRRMPAHSFGAKLPSFDIRTAGPGPAAYTITTNLTRHGPDGIPKYSMADRLREMARYKTPGPGAYAPEEYSYPKSRRPPAWTMAARTFLTQRNTDPSPAEYTLPSCLGMRVPNMRGAPSHSMGTRTKQNDFTQDMAKTPGPAAYGVPYLNTYRTKPPAYSLQSRRPIAINKDVPGPATYNPAFDGTKPGAPHFSLGIKHSPWKAEVRGTSKDDELWDEIAANMNDQMQQTYYCSRAEPPLPSSNNCASSVKRCVDMCAEVCRQQQAAC